MMANTSVFAATLGRLLPPADARDFAGSKACAHTEAHALAHLSMTWTVSASSYPDGQAQVDVLVKLAGASSRSFRRKRRCLCGQGAHEGHFGVSSDGACAA